MSIKNKAPQVVGGTSTGTTIVGPTSTNGWFFILAFGLIGLLIFNQSRSPSDQQSSTDDYELFEKFRKSEQIDLEALSAVERLARNGNREAVILLEAFYKQGYFRALEIKRKNILKDSAEKYAGTVFTYKFQVLRDTIPKEIIDLLSSFEKGKAVIRISKDLPPKRDGVVNEVSPTERELKWVFRIFLVKTSVKYILSDYIGSKEFSRDELLEVLPKVKGYLNL